MSFRPQPFNRTIPGADNSRAFYAKTVGRTNAAGAELTTASLQNVTASSYIEFLLNGAGDAGINDYSGAGGAAGRILITDAAADTIEEIVNIINGIGAGQPGTNRRWRAAFGDVHPKYALGGDDLLNQASPVSTLVGREHEGVSVNLDSSALASANELWVGIGTEGGTRAGSGMVVPDYFEDLPGESGVTGFSSNTPDRTRRRAKQNDDSVVVATKRAVITAIVVNALFATTKVVSVFHEDQADLTSPIYQESMGAAVVSNVFNGQRGAELKGPWGKKLFLRVQGTGAFTDGSVAVLGYYEQGLDPTRN